MNPRILVIDDEPRMAEIVGMVLRRDGFEVVTSTRSQDALALHEKDPFDLVLTDLRMPAPDGLEVLRRVRTASAETPVILFTAHATVSNAIEALRDGAFDYIQKPFDNDALRACVRRALELNRLSRENRYLRAELRQRHALGDIIASSDAMTEVLDLVRRAARSPATVLITGESGTGKELIARAVHFHSDRVAGPFVAVNCKAFAEGLLESELFGHERGAFTGADRTRKGLFEEAAGGTLFLDEIGEISESFQAKLLRVLQEREIRRIGDDRTRPIDVRIVVATNRDLQKEVAEGRFREDLFFRLAVIPIRIPPLRERPEDILPLARHFLVEHQRASGRRFEHLGEEVELLLISHAWPGNVRELENAIERAVVLAAGDTLRPSDLLLMSQGGNRQAPERSDETLQATLDQATIKAIETALAASGGAKSDAAQHLGIDRTTLYRLIRKYALGGDSL
jgi:DNA-binding NtrC family response regulator